MDITSAIGAINSAIRLVGKLREIAKSARQAEMKGVIADLANELADAKLNVAGLKDELAALGDENARLKAMKEEGKPKVKWGCYVFEDDENLYCPACWDTKGRKHLTTRVDSRKRSCSVCRTILFA